MTPESVAQSWNLHENSYSLLTLDFVSGIFFFLIDSYSVSSLNAYTDAATHALRTYDFATMGSIGRSLLTFKHFKSTYPEYFI
jgi:hypothetical protein